MAGGGNAGGRGALGRPGRSGGGGGRGGDGAGHPAAGGARVAAALRGPARLDFPFGSGKAAPRPGDLSGSLAKIPVAAPLARGRDGIGVCGGKKKAFHLGAGGGGRAGPACGAAAGRGSGFPRCRAAGRPAPGPRGPLRRDAPATPVFRCGDPAAGGIGGFGGRRPWAGPTRLPAGSDGGRVKESGASLLAGDARGGGGP